jgi:hypothetical protein
MKLSKEQKAYLNSIESKKIRIKAKKEMKFWHKNLSKFEEFKSILDYEEKLDKKFFGNDTSENFESISNKLKDINNIKVEYNLVKEEPNKKILFTIDECTPFTKEMLESLTKPKQENKLEYTLEDIEKCFESARATKEPFTKDFFFKDFKQYFNLKLTN